MDERRRREEESSQRGIGRVSEGSGNGREGLGGLGVVSVITFVE